MWMSKSGAKSLPFTCFHFSDLERGVGQGRLELPTPRLSSVCSNQLSYRPVVPVFQFFR